jgi:DNA polymerase III epsilon subunit family exonuclease
MSGMIQTTPFIVVDLETTGLEPKLDKIIEIAAVKVQGGQIVDEWNTLVNPGMFLPQVTTDITGITTEMVQDAPTFPDVVDDFLSFMGEGSVFVAHNVEFDRCFVNEHLIKHEREELQDPYMCTFKLAKQVHPNLARYNLGFLAESFGIDLSQAHRALHDAKATAELFIKFMRVLENGGLKQVRDIPVIQNIGRAPKEEVAEGQISLF